MKAGTAGLTAHVVMRRGLDRSLAVTPAPGPMMSVPPATLAVRRTPEMLIRGGVEVVTCLPGVLAFVKLLSQ